MCAVSAVGDNWRDQFPQRPYYDGIMPWINQSPPPPNTTISREEFDALKRDIEELKSLLVAAKKFDEATGQKDCEMAEKIDLIRKLAKLVNVDLGDVFS